LLLKKEGKGKGRVPDTALLTWVKLTTRSASYGLFSRFV